MIVTSVAAVTTKFIFGMCTSKVDTNVGTGMLGILQVCGYVHMSLAKDCIQ